MPVFNNILAGASGQAGGAAAGYEIERSLRFNSADSAYLSRVPVSAGNRKTWTWAGWVKRSAFGSTPSLFSVLDGGSIIIFGFESSETLRLQGSGINVITTPVYRDPSAWYHVVLSFDTTQATAADRVKIHVNGAIQGVSGTYPTLNTDYSVNVAAEHQIASYNASAGRFFDGYLADVHFIDGQALDPTDFGEFDDNGVWQPIEYAGTYGTNGFYLPFSDNSSASALGTDTSGNGNDWTVNNITPLGQVSPESGVITAVNTVNGTYSSSAVFNAQGTAWQEELSGDSITKFFDGVTGSDNNMWSARYYTLGDTVTFPLNVAASQLEVYIRNSPDAFELYADGVQLYNGTGSIYTWVGGTVSSGFVQNMVIRARKASDYFSLAAVRINGSTILSDSFTQTQLTLATNKDLTKFSSGDFVRQDSGGTPSSPSSWTVKTGLQATNYLNATSGTRGLRAVERLPQQGVLFVDTSLLPGGWSLNITPLGTPLYIRTVTSDQGAGMTFSSANVWNYEGISTEMQFNASTSGLSRYIIISHLIAGPIDFLFASDVGLPVGNVASTNTSANTMTISGSTGTWSANTSNYVIGPNTLSSTPDVDSLLDSPTNGDTANDTGAGGEVPGNYCTWNVLDAGASITARNGNLDAYNVNTANKAVIHGTTGVTTGKWYWEVTFNSLANWVYIGVDVLGIGSGLVDYLGGNAGNKGFGIEYNSSGTGVQYSYYWGNSYQGTTPSGNVSVGTVIGLALDADAGTLGIYYNGVFKGNAFVSLTQANLKGPLTPAVAHYGNAFSLTANFGQRPFAYSAPSGYKALCTANLDTPTIEDGSTAMDVVLWTGNSSTQTISGMNMSPDWVWVKGRAGSLHPAAFDTVRGANKYWYPSLASAEVSGYTNTLTSFNSDGFTLGADSSNQVNLNTYSYVGWCWDAGTSTVANTDGDISSSVRVNANAGFSIVSYTGNGSNNQTVGHGLGVTPSVVIVKSRDGGQEPLVYHKEGTAGKNLLLHLNNSEGDWSEGYITSPNSTTFNLAPGSSSISNINVNTHKHIAYCMAAVEGFSSFGKFTGNGLTDGPFIYTGHRTRWLMIKRLTASGSWWIWDTERDTYNVSDAVLRPTSNDENTYSGLTDVDILSNGFKLRGNGADVNASGGIYIFFSFAENPFKYARAR